MIASFHLINYRGRKPSPGKPTDDPDGLRFWRPLNVGGNFAWFREHPTRRALYPRLKPDFHRWAYYAVWADESALDDFLTRSTLAKSWSEQAVEALHFGLRPIRVTGEWPGVRLLDDSLGDRHRDGPFAYLVRLDLTLRGTLAMWGWAAPGIFKQLPDRDRMLLGIPLVDRPYVQPVSFTVWRSREDAMAFVHKGHGHRVAVEQLQHAQHDLLPKHSSAAFLPYRCDGTWEGGNPVAA